MARDITQLHPKLQLLLKELQVQCANKGLKIGISECLRTVAEQDALYAQGRTTAGNIVTNAKGSTYSSMHQWGIAFDFYRNDGKGAYYDNDGFFTKVGKIGQEIGLEWGGSWKSFVDKPHFQLSDWGTSTSTLKKQYGTPEKFMATWKSDTTNSNKTKPSKTWIKSLQTTLNNLGYKDSNGKKLVVDGIVGKATHSACPTIGKGSKGELVKLIQERLNELGFNCGTADGIYGTKTGEAVKTVQKNIIGVSKPNTTIYTRTWAVLLGIYNN